MNHDLLLHPKSLPIDATIEDINNNNSNNSNNNNNISKQIRSSSMHSNHSVYSVSDLSIGGKNSNQTGGSTISPLGHYRGFSNHSDSSNTSLKKC